MIKQGADPTASELGKKSAYDALYDPTKLFPIQRQANRAAIGIASESLPFFGFDRWNHYEVSWLNARGKPIVAVAAIRYGCDSPCLIESKSMKLYFNSFNNTSFKDVVTLEETVIRDLSTRVGAPVSVQITPVQNFVETTVVQGFSGICLDEIDVPCHVYDVAPQLLTVEKERVTEVLHSNILKSNCLVTYQPDWGSVQIAYTGKKINREGLLKYIVSFRNHHEFHEHCIERIFMDILERCQPEALTIDGRYTRRGGIDINPYRSTHPCDPATITTQRLCRQ